MLPARLNFEGPKSTSRIAGLEVVEASLVVSSWSEMAMDCRKEDCLKGFDFETADKGAFARPVY